MTELLIRQSIEVAAPAEVLWKILTHSEFIRQYMFGCNAESEWKPGSPLRREYRRPRRARASKAASSLSTRRTAWSTQSSIPTPRSPISPPTI